MSRDNQRRQSANEIEDGMFARATNRWLSDVNSRQRNYGVAVSDVDNDGQFEMIVAGYSVRGHVEITFR